MKDEQHLLLVCFFFFRVSGRNRPVQLSHFQMKLSKPLQGPGPDSSSHHCIRSLCGGTKSMGAQFQRLRESETRESQIDNPNMHCLCERKK